MSWEPFLYSQLANRPKLKLKTPHPCPYFDLARAVVVGFALKLSRLPDNSGHQASASNLKFQLALAAITGLQLQRPELDDQFPALVLFGLGSDRSVKTSLDPSND